jgi:hypothetical protein
MPYKDPEKRKLKHREYSRKHYEANKREVIERTQTRKKSLRTQWIEYKESVSCIKCGLSHPAAIDFHHVSPSPGDRKIFEILRCNNFSAALEEIKKCVPLCSNCHRIHHHDERSRKRLAKKKKNPTL